ncbi:unnamed protein product [Adineta ricciae]|uniref:WD repeat-containing protein 76 n=1 Tax=Adineta ricciae TaxID=249248 RepID=A0A814FLK6_ADIRI|nr:unnamed protein product [Adineta ricciae]
MPVALRSRSLRGQNESEATLSLPVTKRRARTKVEIPEEDEMKEEPMRNIEEIRRKNLEDNKAFLEGLLMIKIRDDFKSLTHSLQPEGKKRDYKYITVSENVPVRRSRRLAHMDVDGNKLPSPEVSDSEMNANEDENTVVMVKRQKVTKRIVSQLTPEEQEALNAKIKLFFEDNQPVVESTKSTFNFSDLDVTDENVLKLTPDRLISMDMHSRSDILAVIGCDRKGTVGLVVKLTSDLHGPWSKINYDFHKAYATCCRFDQSNPNCINSTSYDSTFLTCDIIKNQFIEMFKDTNNHGLTAFDYHSPQICLVSEDNGDVLVVDLRVVPASVERFDVTKKRIRSLHINPKKKDEFCVSGTDNCVKVWDLRNMSTMKYCLQTNSPCYGAYYNQAGSHVFAATRDDSVMSFSSDAMQSADDPLDIAPTTKIHHRNYVNRFVTPFTAQPYPLIESHFLIGSNAHPRQITVFDENCKTVASLVSENLNSLATINVGHPTLPIIVGGNSSGRIHVFTGQA